MFSCEICRTPPVAASVIFSLEYLSFMWQGLMGQEFWSKHFHFFSVPFCEFDSLLQPNFEKKHKLQRFDGIDLSHRKSKIAKEFTQLVENIYEGAPFG